MISESVHYFPEGIIARLSSFSVALLFAGYYYRVISVHATMYEYSVRILRSCDRAS